ncbi:MAG: sulfatase-like hydrolase/transferase [Alphaproteobacteria bacterium]|nr:sulfatase-like hydrolase/transferase [Alphaproteobacteria bacterium]
MQARIPLATMSLLALWPFTSFLNNNQDDVLIYGGAVSLYGLIFLAGVLLAAVLAISFLGRARASAVAHVLGVGSVLLFSYLPLSSLLSVLGISLGSIRIAIWMVISLFILILVWRASRFRQTSQVLAMVALVIMVVPLLGLANFFLRGSTGIASETEMSVAEPHLQPNVYWFVFDAYSRSDVLEDYFGYDNSGFLDALGERSFEVAKGSLANYASTKLSISTTATMEYFIPVDAPLHPSMWTARLQGFNPVVKRFRSLGYDYIHAEPGGNNLKTRCGGVEDICVKSTPLGVISISEAEVGLLQLTPAFPVIRRLFPSLLSFDFTNVGDVTARLDFGSQKPFFLFAHILSPHPPQRFDAKCSLLARVEFDLSGEDYSKLAEDYLNDLRCLNGHILEAVDLILANDQSDPIIVLQSDHGFRGKGLRPVRSTVRVAPELISYANLHAMRLPESCNNGKIDDFSLVNTFRIVLPCVDGKSRELLPTRKFRKKNGALHAF